MSNLNIEEYKTEDSERYKIYQKKISKYPNADITQKLAVFLMSHDDTKRYVSSYPSQEELYEFKVKILEKGSTNDEVVKKLLHIFNNQLENLSELRCHYFSPIFLIVMERKRLMRRCSIRLFDHMLGFIYDEIKRAELITELNDDDSENLTKYQKDIRFIGEKMKKKIENYLNNQKEFWKEYSKKETVEKGDYYYKYDQPNFFNIYKHTNFKLEEVADLFARDVRISYEKSSARKFHLENENIAEDDMKKFMHKFKTDPTICERMYLDSAMILQICLGHWPKVHAKPSDLARHDPSYKIEEEPFKEFRAPKNDYDGPWDGFLPVTDTEIMAPILITGLIHFVEDYLRPRYIEHKEEKRRKEIEASKSMFESIGYIGNLLGIGYKEEKKENNALEVRYNNVASSSQNNDAVINDSVISISSNSTEEQPDNNNYFSNMFSEANKKAANFLENTRSILPETFVGLAGVGAGITLGPQAAIITGFFGGLFLLQHKSLTNQDPENMHLTSSQPDDEPDYVSINHTQNEQQDRLEQSRNNQDSRENNI